MKTTTKYDCRYCGRWFDRKQALRGHLRWCEARSRSVGSQEPMAKPMAKPANVKRSHATARLQEGSFRQSQPPRRVAGHANEGLLCLLDIQEQLLDLRNDAIQFVRMSRLAESSPNYKGAGSEEWGEVCLKFHRWLQAIERMLEEYRVDRAIVWDICRGLPSVKERWLRYIRLNLTALSTSDRYDEEPGIKPGQSLREALLDEEARFDELLGNVKALLASLGQS